MHVYSMMGKHSLETFVVIEDNFAFPETISKQNLMVTSTPAKVINLVCLEKELYLEGSLQSLCGR